MKPYLTENHLVGYGNTYYVPFIHLVRRTEDLFYGRDIIKNPNDGVWYIRLSGLIRDSVWRESIEGIAVISKRMLENELRVTQFNDSKDR